MIKTLFIDSSFSEDEILQEVENNPDLKEKLNQLEYDDKEYIVGLDIAQQTCNDCTAITWVRKDEKGNYIVMDSKIVEKEE